MKIFNLITSERIFKIAVGIQLIALFLFSGFCVGQNNSSRVADSVKIKNTDPSISGILDGKELNLKYFKWKSDANLRNDSIKIFSLSPISKRVNKVNGFVLGVGHYENQNIKLQTVNGLNVEASPLSLVLFTYCINVPFESIFVGINDNAISNVAFFDDLRKTYIKINGVNLSSGGFMGGAEFRGINVSIISAMNKMNGFSVGGILNTKSFAGVSISGLANLSDFGSGIQIGVSNVSRRHNGVQIGLFNNSKNLRGMQFGLWNTNGKRRLPFVNWQFKS
ncbi:LA_2272 family surface repeat-containing protein [Flavobacterium mesophilum]|uniref:LA_2272 family surface repeat-containing protein n=1 Tax=Flavobacterium mesophilum TaxID=3143495 RepID=UPI0031DBD86D